MAEPAAPPRIPSLLLWMSIRPMQTIRWIVENRGARGTLALVVVLAVASTIVSIPLESYSAGSEAWSAAGALGILVGLLIFVGALVTAGYFAIAGLTLMSGRWLGGKASFSSIRAALAWGMAPLYWGLLMRIPAAIFWPEAHAALNSDRVVRIGEETVRMSGLGEAPPLQLLILITLEFIIVTWGFVTLSRALAAVQEFSGWEGFANLVIAVVLPITAIIVVAVATALAF